MKKILVTGGAGFIGSNFCNTFSDEYHITALDNLLLGDERHLKKRSTFLFGDACKTKDLDKVGPVDYVLHLAGSSSAPMFSGDNLANAYANSVESFARVLEWAGKNGVQKVAYASTSSLYGNNPIPLVETQKVTPQNHYSVTKFLYEHLAACFVATHPEMDIVGFRFMSVYGPNEEAKGKYANIISQFAWDMARGLSPVLYGDGKQFRDFTNVADVLSAIKLVFDSEEKMGAEVFNIGTGKTASLNEIVAALNDAFGSNIAPKYIQNPVKENYIFGQCADISKIQTRLGFTPKVALKDGIAKQVSELRMERIRETSSDEYR